VKKSRLVAALAASLIGLGLAGPAVAQQASAPPIVVLDMTKVFKSHPRYVAEMADLKAKVTAAETAAQKDKAAILARKEQLQRATLSATSPEYRQQEEEIMQLEMNLSKRVQMQKKELFLQEVTINFSIYQEIMAHVERYCTAYNISMVVRYNSEKLDKEHPESLLQLMNQPVVYQKGIDITQIIMNAIGPGNGGGTAARPSNMMVNPIPR
jgi:Skp family chaperone for outer membrane proteins